MEIAHGGHQGDPESPGPPVRRQGLYLLRIADDLHKKNPRPILWGFSSRPASLGPSPPDPSRGFLIKPLIFIIFARGKSIFSLMFAGLRGTARKNFPGRGAWAQRGERNVVR